MKYLIHQDVDDNIVRRVLHHGDLFRHDALFLADLRGVVLRAADHVQQKIYRLRKYVRQRLDVVAGRFLVGERVQRRADIVRFLSQLQEVSFLCAFEAHMLDKMGNAVLLRRFSYGAGSHPYPYAGGSGAGDLLRDQANAAGQSFLFDHNRL